MSDRVPDWRFMLNNIYSDLKGCSLRAADYLLDNDNDELAAMGIVELASASRTSVSTVQRLCKSMGFKRFKDFKLSVAQNTREKRTNAVISPGDSLSEAKEKIFRSNIEAIQNTSRILDEGELAKAIELLKRARSVSLFAVGGSSALALDAAHKFLRIGLKCHCVSDVDHQSKHAVLLGPEDVVVAISYSGKTGFLLENIATAKERGASIIAVTGYGRSPLSRMSDAVLFSCSSESGFVGDLISRRVAQLTLIDILFLGVALTDYARYSQYMELTQGVTEKFKRKTPPE